jgi:hypothetical protein
LILIRIPAGIPFFSAERGLSLDSDKAAALLTALFFLRKGLLHYRSFLEIWIRYMGMLG